MNLDHCRPMQRRPFQFGKLFLSKPKGAPEGARKHIQISANAVTHHFSYGSNYFHVRGQGEFGCRLRSYGFQSEPGRRRSAMRKSMTRRRSSTRPSSKSARHRGPTSGSCSTRIGVMARSSGTTIATPAPHRRNARMSLVNSGGGGEERRVTVVGARLGGGGGEDTKALAAACADRAAAEVGAVGLQRKGRGRGLGGSKGWTGYGKGRGSDLEPLEEGFELGVDVGSGGCHGSVRVRRIARVRWRELQSESRG